MQIYSRALKFRAWEKNQKRMCYSNSESSLGLVDFFKEIANPAEFYKLMQYTGLKDKNGKEIFEGDIVKHSSEKIMKVVYNPSTSQLILHYTSENSSGEYSWPHKEYIEIIGNVWEHPELLSKTMK